MIDRFSGYCSLAWHLWSLWTWKTSVQDLLAFFFFNFSLKFFSLEIFFFLNFYFLTWSIFTVSQVMTNADRNHNWTLCTECERTMKNSVANGMPIPYPSPRLRDLCGIGGRKTLRSRNGRGLEGNSIVQT